MVGLNPNLDSIILLTSFITFFLFLVTSPFSPFNPSKSTSIESNIHPKSIYGFVAVVTAKLVCVKAVVVKTLYCQSLPFSWSNIGTISLFSGLWSNSFW